MRLKWVLAILLLLLSCMYSAGNYKKKVLLPGDVLQARTGRQVAAMHEALPVAASQAPPAKAADSSAARQEKLPSTGTVVLDVEQGGIEVPSFVGKTVRGAVEAAQDIGLDLEAVGSGVARQQSPVAGTHVAAGARVTVQFGK